MLFTVILHPSVVAAATSFFRDFAQLSVTSQIVLCTLIQVKAAAMRDTPLAENLTGIMRVMGEAHRVKDQEDLEQATDEVYATLQTMARREAGEGCPPAVSEGWWRDIS